MIATIIKETLMITSFVLAMMLIIEYINVQTRGNWSKPLKKSGWLQIVAAAILGILPGCLGTYTAVSLYTHNIFSFAAIITVMIATFGDEAFVMFSVMPVTSLKLMLYIFIIAIVTGGILFLIFKNKTLFKHRENHLSIHNHGAPCISFDRKMILKQLKHISFPRAILIFSLLLFIFGVISGQFSHDHSFGLPNQSEVNQQSKVVHGNNSHEHHDNELTHIPEVESTTIHQHKGEWDWIRITFLFISVFALFILTAVNDHFLEEHLWGHIIKKHFLKIFLWTFGALLFIFFLEDFLHLEEWVKNNQFTILIIALLIGIIPESGPHYIFIFMFLDGTIPFSILLANSIVQDGHGALPLLAESRKSFFVMKIVNIIVGLIIGLSGLFFGW